MECDMRVFIYLQIHEGKTILYICNDYYIDYNMTLQSALYLSSTLSVPLLLLLLRPAEEYSYPLSFHTLHLLQHLSQFNNQLQSLSITSLLLFTTSLSTALSEFIDQTSPLFILTDPFDDIRYQNEFNSLIKHNHSISEKLLLFSNHYSLPMNTGTSIHLHSFQNQSFFLLLSSINPHPSRSIFYQSQYQRILHIPSMPSFNFKLLILFSMKTPFLVMTVISMLISVSVF